MFRHYLAMSLGLAGLSAVQAQTTVGPQNPGSGTNNAGIGTNAWTNAGNTLTSNDSRATVATRGLSQYLAATNFGFAIPSPANITGIQVDVERSTTGPANVAVLNGWTTGTSKTISAGTNRCLVVAYAQENGLGRRDVTGMTYGGRAMTNVGQASCGTNGSFMGHLEVWILLEADIALAVGTAIAATYGAYTDDEYCEVFSSAVFSGVDQVTPVTSVQTTGAVSPPSTSNPHQLGAAINTLTGGMAINVVTEGNNSTPNVANGGTNTYTINSGYTEGTDIYFANTVDAPTSGGCLQTAHKSTGNGTEQPTCTFNGTVNRWAMIGFHLQRGREVDHSIRLIKSGSVVGNNLATTTSWPTTDTYASYGSTSELWGTTWTLAEINASNFGVAISARVQNGTARVDHVRVRVTYYSTLPVELIAFNATAEDRAVRLDWATATEHNNSHFSVQRSRDAVHFEDIAEIPGAGNSNAVRQYSTRDEQPWSGTSYYRLVQHDIDGTQDVSDIVVVERDASAPGVYPNPTADGSLTFWDPGVQQLAVAVYDDKMRLVRQAAVNSGEPAELLNDLADGSYTVLVRSGEEVHATRVMRVSSTR